jgi:hypothetical protein
LWAVRDGEGRSCSRGTHSADWDGKSKPSGMMPTTACCTPAITIDSPPRGRDPRQRSQKRAPTSTTFGASVRSSSARNPRPRAGWTPITAKKSLETRDTRSDCGSPAPVTGCGNVAVSAIAAKPRVCACQSRKLGSETLAPRVPFSPIWNSCTMRPASG